MQGDWCIYCHLRGGGNGFADVGMPVEGQRDEQRYRSLEIRFLISPKLRSAGETNKQTKKKPQQYYGLLKQLLWIAGTSTRPACDHTTGL